MKMSKKISNRAPIFAVCVRNRGYKVSLELLKVYRVLPDPDAAAVHRMRVIDETGEDYLFPESYFVPVELPEAAAKAVLQAS